MMGRDNEKALKLLILSILRRKPPLLSCESKKWGINANKELVSASEDVRLLDG